MSTATLPHPSSARTQPVSSPSTSRQGYGLVREHYFASHPEDMELFQEMLYKVPEVVSHISHAFQLTLPESQKTLNHLYQKGVRELISICSHPAISNRQAFENYVDERLSSTLLSEIEVF